MRFLSDSPGKCPPWRLRVCGLAIHIFIETGNDTYLTGMIDKACLITKERRINNKSVIYSEHVAAVTLRQRRKINAVSQSEV